MFKPTATFFPLFNYAFVVVFRLGVDPPLVDIYNLSLLGGIFSFFCSTLLLSVDTSFALALPEELP